MQRRQLHPVLSRQYPHVNAEYQCPDIHQSVLWAYLYDEVTKGIPSPIKLEEGLETVRITEEAFRKSGFEPIKRFKSKL